MMQRVVEWLARRPRALLLVVAMALVAAVVNEASFQHSHATLARGVALTDAHIQAARTVQILIDAEASASAYLNSSRAADAADYRHAAQKLPEAQDAMFRLIARLDPDDQLSVEPLRTRIGERVQSLAQWVALASAGQQSQAQQLATSDRARLNLAELRLGFEQMLARAASVQEMALGSLYNAMRLNRVALHALAMLTVLALLLIMRQLHAADGERVLERRRLESQIGTRTSELRELAGHLVDAREDERGRVARELHDEMGGLFTAMKLEFSRLRRVPDMPAAAHARLAGIESRLNNGIALKRRIVENLRPTSLDQLGLCAALEMLCTDTAANLGIAMHHNLQPVPLSKEAELTVYRLVQEALTNISKYAQARVVNVSLAGAGGPPNGMATVSVQDDGRGFNLATVRAAQHGLLGMRVRVESHAGILMIDSAPGGGTRITAQLPTAGLPMPRHD